MNKNNNSIGKFILKARICEGKVSFVNLTDPDFIGKGKGKLTEDDITELKGYFNTNIQPPELIKDKCPKPNSTQKSDMNGGVKKSKKSVYIPQRYLPKQLSRKNKNTHKKKLIKSRKNIQKRKKNKSKKKL